jgi:hypothetical protein
MVPPALIPYVRAANAALANLPDSSSRNTCDLNASLYLIATRIDTGLSVAKCQSTAGRDTTGRGIKDKKNIVTLSLKDVLGYPLTRDFREKLCGDTVP